MKIFSFLFTILFPQIIFAQEQKIYLDPKAAISTSVSQLFQEVEFVPLETTRQSTFDRPAAMIVTNSYFIILDRTLASVFFFAKAGKFLSVFKNREYDILDMKYIPSENKVFIQTQKRGYAFTEKQKFDIIRKNSGGYYKIWTCDLNVPKNFQFEPVANFLYAGYTLYPVSGSEFLASAILSGKDFPEQVAYEMKYIRDNKVSGNFFPYNQQRFTPYYNHLNHVSFFNSSNDSILFTRPYHYEIYTFKNGQVSTKYKLIFPASQSLPPDFFKRNLSTETDWEVLRKNHQGAVQNILPVLSWNHHLVFWLSTLQPNNMRDFRQYLLDIDSHTLINARRIEPDDVSYNLSINFTGLVAEDESSVYTFMFADELIQAAKGGSGNYPAVLKTFIEKANSNANPVIIRLIKRSK